MTDDQNGFEAAAAGRARMTREELHAEVNRRIAERGIRLPKDRYSRLRVIAEMILAVMHERYVDELPKA